jgi:hypothetical protein
VQAPCGLAFLPHGLWLFHGAFLLSGHCGPFVGQTKGNLSKTTLNTIKQRKIKIAKTRDLGRFRARLGNAVY